MSAALGAAGWREFLRARGMHELGALLDERWQPLAPAAAEAREASVFRVASLLGSRASRTAIEAELARIRRDDLGVPADPEEDACAAAAIAAWFATAPR